MQFDEFDRYKKNEDIMVELKNFEVIFGEDAIRYTPIVALEQLEVEMIIPPLSVLTFTTAKAWGVDPETPIIIKVPMHDQYFLNALHPPIVEVFQYHEGKKKDIQIGKQIEKLLLPFLDKHWPSKSGITLRATTKLTDDDKPKFRGKSEATITKVIDKEALGSLLNMGFDESLCREALMLYNNLEDAVDFLTGGTPAPPPEDTSKAREKKPKRRTGKKEKPILVSQRSSSLSSSGKKNASSMNDLFTNPQLAYKARTAEEKYRCNSEFGFLCMIMGYVRSRIPQLNNFCVICDQPHVFTSGNMLMPAVCSRELCVWGFQQLGVGSGAASDIATEAEVVDLLVCMATFSLKSARKDIIFDPYPSVADPHDANKMILSPTDKDFRKVQDILARMPSVQKMTQAQDFISMKDNMDTYHPHCFPLLQWILSSNRSHIVQLNEKRLVKSMCTPFQYMLLSDSPEKEENFRKLKKEHGTVFAFHGSSIENWHGILRKGLINASGTKLQMNGAACGSGVYISPSAATSFGYCRMTRMNNSQIERTKQRFLDTSKPVGCIAICELIDKDIKKSGDIWVHPHSDMVCTRFFFVYPNEQVGSASSCRTDQTTFVEELRSALTLYS
eukprot:TRINITY_DN2618_c0_g1_i1.p1 TRINITY_DN2618_c0_g1~~TRINITY_DN2618_c0_g1_i1.p1  ORF type:complete len:718 (-),score=131.16 TRINITY_DN2618_c0_g1_i1:43-1887(-)